MHVYGMHNKNCCKFTDLLLILQICNSLFCMNTKQKDDYTDSLVMRPSVDYQQRCILFSI